MDSRCDVSDSFIQSNKNIYSEYDNEASKKGIFFDAFNSDKY